MYRRAPKDGQLLFELSYAYNALRRTADAERVLVKAVKDLPRDFFINREYAYLLLNLQQHDKAIAQYKHCIEICPKADMTQKSEAAFNLAQAYNQSGDATNAATWFDNARQWAPEGSPVAEFFKNKTR